MRWPQAILDRIRWYRWYYLDEPFRIGSEHLGHGEQREINRDLLWDRYIAREPIRGRPGLTTETTLTLD